MDDLKKKEESVDKKIEDTDELTKMACVAFVEALDALDHFQNTGDRSKFGEWLDKYEGMFKDDSDNSGDVA